MLRRRWFPLLVAGAGLLTLLATACAQGGRGAEAAALITMTPSRTATPSGTPRPVTPVACAVLAAELQVRSGPGTVFPVEGRLARNTVAQAVAFVPAGIPGGRWVAVERVTPGKRVSFISAEPRFLFCRSSLAALPIATIPATPRPAATRTPRPTPTRIEPLALVPVAGDLSASPNIRGRDPRNEGALVLIPGLDQARADEALEQDGIIRFDDALVFAVDVFDDQVGTRTGDGIREVQFDVYYFDENGDKVQVHLQRERNVPYCVFGDARGRCNVWRFSEHDNRWPNGEPLTPDTVFSADITITATSGDQALWLWKFRMD
jgi:hypothetical protein